MERLNKAQLLEELKRIADNNLTLKGYIAFSRVGTVFRLTRTDRKTIYAIYVRGINIKNALLAKRQTRKKGISKEGLNAYDNICKQRDEIMYESA